MHRAATPALVQVEGQQMIQQIVAPGNAAEHVADPARGFLLARQSARCGSGHVRDTASGACSRATWSRAPSMDSSTALSGTPVTISTAPILTGSTKCTW